MPRIHQLPASVITKIAAGEVIERPASVVKELVENALDAGATRVEIATAGGGLTMIRVTDDGAGMEMEELPLAIGRHCTSKLDGGINDIRSLGFRGEALPSIGSVARLKIRSRPPDADMGAEIAVEGGRAEPVRPVAANRGTMVEVRDLFYATPARLKFMKSARAEAAGIGIERADDLPQISAELIWQRSESGSQTGNQNPWLTRYGPALTLTYLLYDFGAGDSRVQAAEYRALAAALSQNRVLQDLVFQVEQAYYRYLGFDALVRSNELFLKSVSTSLDATQRRRDGGQEDEGDPGDHQQCSAHLLPPCFLSCKSAYHGLQEPAL